MLEFLNNNAGIVAILGVIVGWFLNIVTEIIRNYFKKKEEQKRRELKKFENKAELFLNKNYEDNEIIPRIKVALLSYDGNIDNPQITNTLSKKHEKAYFYFENIGKADIHELSICVTVPERQLIYSDDTLKNIKDNKILNFSVDCDERIFVNQAFELEIGYCSDDSVFNFASASLAIIYRDSLGNICEQPFFPDKNKIYEPTKISPKQYTFMLNTSMILNNISKDRN